MEYFRFLPPEQLHNIRAHIGMGFVIGNPWDKEFDDGHRINTDVLEEYVHGGPTKSFYQSLYGEARHLTDLKYLCVGYPKGKTPAVRTPKKNQVWISDRRATVDVPGE
jgi:hypothetical protein